MNDAAAHPTIPKRYANLMTVVKARLIESRGLLEGDVDIFVLERIGIHLRKLIEAVAHASLIACEMNIGVVPRQIRNSCNAEDTIKFLQRRNLLHLPKCARATLDENLKVWTVDVFEPSDDLIPWLLDLYQQSHSFAHEPSPYAQWQYFSGLSADYINEQRQIAQFHHRQIWNWLWQHVVQVGNNWYIGNFGLVDTKPVSILEISKPPLPASGTIDQRIGSDYRET